MSSPRAIIVDDSPTLRSVLRADLESAGWSVTEEADGEAAAMSALGDPPDVLISDIWMPGINGLQLCRLLSEEQATRNVPVVLLTGSGDRRARFWASRSGATAFVNKGELRSIPKLLASLPLKRPPSAPPSRPSNKKELGRGDVGRRLSDLLDNALFHTVFAREVQDLAASSTTHEELVHRFASLLSEVLSFRWIALVQRGSGDAEHIAEGIRPTVTGVLREGEFAIAEPGDAPPGAYTTLLEQPIVHAGEHLGRLVVALAESRGGPADEAVIETGARALAVPIRLMNLLAEGRMLACTDALTGLPNRRHGELVLTQSLAVAERASQPISVAFLDIDHFKRINDEHGHAVGDQMLEHVAHVLKSTMRKSDVAVRWGGEEFVILLTNTALAGARIALERIRARIEASALTVGGGELRATVSMGLAVAKAEPMSAWLDRADEALYRAKARGRNRIEVAG